MQGTPGTTRIPLLAPFHPEHRRGDCLHPSGTSPRSQPVIQTDWPGEQDGGEGGSLAP